MGINLITSRAVCLRTNKTLCFVRFTFQRATCLYPLRFFSVSTLHGEKMDKLSTGGNKMKKLRKAVDEEESKDVGKRVDAGVEQSGKKETKIHPFFTMRMKPATQAGTAKDGTPAANLGTKRSIKELESLSSPSTQTTSSGEASQEPREPVTSKSEESAQSAPGDMENNVSQVPQPAAVFSRPIESLVTETAEPLPDGEPQKEFDDDFISDSSDSSLDSSPVPTNGKGSAQVAAKGAANAAISHKNYHPIKDAPWNTSPGQVLPYQVLVELFSLVEAMSGRIEITSALTNFLRTVIANSPQDLLPCLYLLTNTLYPTFEGKELGVGDSLLIKAISEATGRQTRDVRTELDEKGDLGIVAEGSRTKQRTISFGPISKDVQPKSTLTVQGVLTAFRQIAAMEGRASQDRKVGTIKKLLVSCVGKEARYLVRGIQGKLRIGLARQTIIVALAHAISLTGPVGGVCDYNPEGRSNFPPICLQIPATAADLLEAENTLKQVHSELPSFEAIVPVLLSEGIQGAAEKCHLQPGVPVEPMLAKPTRGITEVLDRFADTAFTCEWKYDGERGQVHIFDDNVLRVFSRNTEDMTGKYPDVGIAVRESMQLAKVNFGDEAAVTSCVLDGEVIAYDVEKKTLLPFQILSTRSRKEVSLENIKVPVMYAAFDLLYLNGQSLLRTPLRQRRELLLRHFAQVEGKFTHAISREGNDTAEMHQWLLDAVKDGCEGLMVKVLDGKESTYEPSRRSQNWLKLKKDYMQGMTDSFDLVPVGAWYGKGKRTGVYGAYLLACFDPESEEFQTVCKVGTGFSEENLELLANVFKEKGVVASQPSNVLGGDSGQIVPDVWFDPESSEIWEVAAADLSLSPVHMGSIGLVHPDKGIGLRFPRFLRRRDDKTVYQATNSQQIADMYRAQSTVSGANAMRDDYDD